MIALAPLPVSTCPAIVLPDPRLAIPRQATLAPGKIGLWPKAT